MRERLHRCSRAGADSCRPLLTGNSDSCNGCNCVYDEMIDELTAGDGDSRIEYWKQILLKVRARPARLHTSVVFVLTPLLCRSASLTT